MNLENRWVKKAETIPLHSIEEKYAKLFPSKTEMPATPLRTAYKDNTDQIAVERAFALAKRKYGLGLITSRLSQTSISKSLFTIHTYPINFICHKTSKH